MAILVIPKSGGRETRRIAISARVLQATAAGARKKDHGWLAAVLAACGHPARLAILKGLLGDTGSHARFQKLTGLKAGPLYHHLNQLRLAGLLHCDRRDVYQLSRLGHDLAVVAKLLMRLGGRRRSR
jgi:DNA-binding transcriptional ArsR family regulator